MAYRPQYPRYRHMRQEDQTPYAVSEVICVKCGHRWISVRPESTLLKKIECERCGQGYVVETGQTLDALEQEGD